MDIAFESIALSKNDTQSESHREKNFEVVRISTCHVAGLVNVGAVDAHVTVCVPTRVPVTFVILAPNFVKYAAAVALVPEKRIQ